MVGRRKKVTLAKDVSIQTLRVLCSESRKDVYHRYNPGKGLNIPVWKGVGKPLK